MKLDYKKEYPLLYKPKNKPTIIEVPPMNFFMIDGKGDPNTAKEYIEAIEALYAISYALKMKIIKKEEPEKDYVVPPLEGFWYIDDMSKWLDVSKDEWKWTMMIRIPDYVTSEQIEKARVIAETTKKPIALSKVYVKDYEEKKVVQMMHIGSYAEEHANIMRMHQYAIENGYSISGHHHEIYLSDPRKVDSAKLKTIIRQPIRK
jgi:hypothetical protein